MPWRFYFYRDMPLRVWMDEEDFGEFADVFDKGKWERDSELIVDLMYQPYFHEVDADTFTAAIAERRAESTPPADRAVFSALRDIAEGRGVKRADHALVTAEGRPCVALFLEALQDAGYAKMWMSDVQITETERMPAWFVDHDKALARFGWVFWERFAPGRARKLFGTAHKNAKGDWDLMLGERSRRHIYAKPDERIPCDPDNPSQW